MEPVVEQVTSQIQLNNYLEVWEMVVGQLRMEMSRTAYETWVQPLRPIGYVNGTFIVSAFNPYGRDWIENRLKTRITKLIEGLYGQPVRLQITVGEGDSSVRIKPDPISNEADTRSAPSKRKILLQKAYGTERARIIQPERGMFVTLYFLNEWLPLIGHSAAITILAARSMCYWNPLTGELRNTVETEMAELAKRASVSIRTIKDVLNTELVERYFLRYKVRRVMTPNGVRTAGIYLQVRMDDPLTPDDQARSNLPEDDIWYFPEFSNEELEEI